MGADRPRRNPDNAYRSVGDEGGLIVVPSDSRVDVLNPVGAKIFSMLDGTHGVDEIVAAVMDEFDVPEEVARRDTDAFLEDLHKRGLLSRVTEASS